jgi:hypothetical protein
MCCIEVPGAATQHGLASLIRQPVLDPAATKADEFWPKVIFLPSVRK